MANDSTISNSATETANTKPRKSGSNLVAAGIFLSRIAGLIREAIIFAVLGAAADGFRFAMRFPNLIQNLLGEGALSASFIPVYAKLVEDKEYKKADSLAKSVLTLLIIATTLLVLLFVLLARPMIWLFTDWETRLPDLYEETITLVRITSVGIGFLVASAWCLGVLNSHRKFFLSYVAPVIWNFAQIAALIIGALYVTTEASIAVLVAWGVVIGGLLQLLLQLPTVLKILKSESSKVTRRNLVTPDEIPAVLARPVEMTLESKIRLKDFPELTEVLKRFTPAVGARSVIQLSSFIDTFLAAALIAGSISLYASTIPLYLLPISLFGFSIAVAELTEMSRVSDSKEKIVQRLSNGLKKVAIPAGFVTAAYLTASQPIVNTLYGIPTKIKDAVVDRFGDQAAEQSETILSTTDTDNLVLAVALILTTFATGLPAAMNARVTQNTLYSLGDVKGPAKIAIVRIVVALSVSLLLMFQFEWLFVENATIKSIGDFPHWPLTERVSEPQGLHLGPIGLAIGSSIASWTEWILLRRRLGKTLGTNVKSNILKQILLAATPSGLAMFGLGQLNIISPIDSFAIVGSGALVYFMILKAQKINPIMIFKN